jgi:hypothetical protein
MFNNGTQLGKIVSHLVGTTEINRTFLAPTIDYPVAASSAKINAVHDIIWQLVAGGYFVIFLCIRIVA